MYPNREQSQIIDNILWEIKVYHNNVMYLIKNLDCELVKEAKIKCKDTDGKPIKDEKGEFVFKTVHYLRRNKLNAALKNKLLQDRDREFTKYIPSYALIPQGSIVDDIAKAFKRTGRNGGNIPIESVEPHYYSKSKPRESFQINARRRELFRFSHNRKVVWVNCGKGLGEIKCRRQMKNLRFSKSGMQMEEFFSCDNNFYKTTDKNGETTNNPAKICCNIKRDNCGDYYLIISLPYIYKCIEEKGKNKCGIDVGYKHKAVIYDATKDEFEKIPNKTFLHKNNSFEQSELCIELKKLNEMKSRKWGYANSEYREANKASGYTLKPSKQYMMVDEKYRKLNRKIKRQREANNHKWSHYIIDKFEVIGLETLSVNEFLKKKQILDVEKLSHNDCIKLHSEKEFRKLAADSGLGQFLSQITYKALWYGNKINYVDKYFASSQICSNCGYKNSEVKNVFLREWTCPICGKHHDRDENAAYNIYFESEKISSLKAG